MSDLDFVSFATDDEPDGPESPRLFVTTAGCDYYVTLGRGDGTNHFPSIGFRSNTSGSRNPLVTFLIACLWKVGTGDLEGAACCARAFADQCDDERKMGQ